MGKVRLLHSPLFDTIVGPNWSKPHGSEKPRKPVDVVQTQWPLGAEKQVEEGEGGPEGQIKDLWHHNILEK